MASAYASCARRCAVLALVATVLSTFWAGSEVRAAAPAVSFLPLDQVREGMTGYGLTVFHGTRVDTFGVRVLGVQRHSRVAGSVILVEVDGPGLDLAAIPQGMSGSPVYLEGKFAGAIAFSWEGALRPIGGLTPAEEMLALPTEPAAAAQEQLRAGASAVALLAPGGCGRELATRLLGATAWVSPAPAPVVDVAVPWPDAAGLATRLMPVLAAPVAGGGGLSPLGAALHCRSLGASSAGRPSGPAGGGPEPAPDLVPGSACAVPLVLGDAELGAIGTVSWRDGDLVGLFGHPLLQAGPVDMPLAGAEVVGIFPSRQMSFKMGGMGDVVGAVYHDQRAGLTGRIGAAAALVPVTVAVTRPGGAERYAFQAVRDPRLTPALVTWCLYNALLARGDDLSRQTIRYRLDADWRRADGSAEPCAAEGVIAGPNGAAEIAPEWASPLQALFDNRHAPLTLAGVTAELNVEPGLDTAVITGVEAAPVARAGEAWPVIVRLQARRGDTRAVRRELVLPRRLAPGRYRLLVASARDVFGLEAQRAGERFADRSLAATLELLRTPRSAGDLVLVLFAPGHGVTVDGRELADLPGSIAGALGGGGSIPGGRVAPTLLNVVLRERVPGGPALEGAAIVPLTILPAAAAATREARP